MKQGCQAYSKLQMVFSRPGIPVRQVFSWQRMQRMWIELTDKVGAEPGQVFQPKPQISRARMINNVYGKMSQIDLYHACDLIYLWDLIGLGRIKRNSKTVLLLLNALLCSWPDLGFTTLITSFIIIIIIFAGRYHLMVHKGYTYLGFGESCLVETI